jgi:membrane protease YdiL (CAAX protease family)
MLQNSSHNQVPAQNVPRKKRIGYAFLLPIWVLVSFFAVQILLLVALQLLASTGFSADNINPAVFSTALGAVVYVLVLVVTIGAPWLIYKRRTTLEEVGLQRLPSWKDLGIAPIGFIAYLIVTAVFMIVAQNTLTFVDFDQQQDVGFEALNLQYEYILAFITLVIIAPLAEEILFRGYLFGKLRKVTSLWVSILITSVLFGIVHLAWNVGIDVFALSIVMCLVLVWSGSLWPSIIIHMTKNFIAFYFLFINPTLLTTMGG